MELSVIVPVYNAEKYLEKCINSIINQTYRDFEVLLINDGSTDSSGSICDKFSEADDRIRVLHTKNKGVSSARNKGLNEATGQWVTFVDSDDWLELNTFQWAMNIIENNDTDLLGWNHYTSYQDKQSISKMIQPKWIKKEGKELYILQLDIMYPNYDLITNNINVGNIRSCWGKLFNRKIIEENNIEFSEELVIAEDALFCMEYLNHINKAVIANEYLYHYRLLDNSADRKYRKNLNEVNTCIMDMFYTFFKDKVINDGFMTCYMGLGYDCLCKSLLYYFLAMENKKNIIMKIKELKKLLKTDQYKKAFKPKINKLFSKKEKLIMWLAKHECAISLYVITFVKESISKITLNMKRSY